MHGWSYLCLMRILFSRESTAEAESLIQKLADLGREADVPPWITNQMIARQTRLWLAQENVVAVSQWMAECGLDIKDKTLPQMDFFLLIDYITVARILLAQGRLDETIWLLQSLHKAAIAGGRISKIIEIKIL